MSLTFQIMRFNRNKHIMNALYNFRHSHVEIKESLNFMMRAIVMMVNTVICIKGSFNCSLAGEYVKLVIISPNVVLLMQWLVLENIL